MPKADDTDDDLELAPLVDLGGDHHHDDHNDPNEKEPTPLKGSWVRLLTTSSNWKSISACALYSSCSVSMILVNKSLASRYVIVSGC